MSVTRVCHAATPSPPPSARLVTFEHHDDCPIPPEYQDSPPAPDRGQFTREGRATSIYQQIIGAVGEPGNQPSSATLPQDDLNDSFEHDAKLLALQRFADCDSFSTYSDHVNQRARFRGQGDLIFLPFEKPGSGRFVSKREFRTQAALHRFSCKCGLANTPLLHLWQSAFCDDGDGRYGDSEAYKWLSIHSKRHDVYGSKGIEAPEWDPFPDGRGVIPRLESERETGEQRTMRAQRWSTTRRTGRVLPQEALRHEAWLPASRVPSGPAVGDRSAWTPEQEQKWEDTVVREEQHRQVRKALLTADAERHEQAGVERLVVSRDDVPVLKPVRLEVANSMVPAAAGPSSGTSGSSSRTVGLSSQTSQATMAMPLVDEMWYTKPAKGRKPLQVVDPKDAAEKEAIPDTKAAQDQQGQQ